MYDSTGGTTAPRDLEEYWAKTPTQEFGAVAQKRIRDFKTLVESTGRLDIWRRATLTYFGLDAEGGWRNSMAVTFSGAEGENLDVRGNSFRMFVRGLVVLATGNSPSYTCWPRAYDAGTTEIVQIGNAICKQQLDRDVRRKMTLNATNASYLGEGWIGSFWDETAGEVVAFDEETGAIGHAGDIAYATFRPDEVVRDVDVAVDDHEYVFLLRRRSRWTLAKRYPEHAAHILAAPSYSADSVIFDLRTRGVSAPSGNVYADQIVTWEFYHRPTDVMPEGRASIIVNGVAIADGANPYERIPVRSMIPSREPSCAWGYAETWDLLALSQLLDSVLSQAATTQENFGLNNIVAMPESQVTAEALSRGTRILYTAQPPASMQGMEGGVENAIAMAKFLTEYMQSLMSMNDASLGSGGSSPSGASLSMQLRLAMQNNAGIISSYLKCFQEVMEDTIDLMRRFASTERLVHVVGRNNSNKVLRFQAADLEALQGVDVELGSAEMRTSEMRHQIMTELLTAGLITSPEQALQMMSTGRLEPAFDGPQAREACIERENEVLQQGGQVVVLDQDFHADHIARHGAVLADIDVRSNPQIVQAVQAHLYEHAEVWARMSSDPIGVTILAATGQQPSPAAAMMAPPMPGGPGMPPGGPGVAAPSPSAPEGAPGPSPDVPDATTNPATGPALPPDARPIPTSYQ